VANLSEATPFLAMVALRIPAALTVMQILAVDLGTDVLPALGLGAEPPEAGLMQQPPRPRQAPLLDGAMLRRSYLFLGLLEAGFAMGAYLLVWQRAGITLPQLQALAPQLLHHQEPASLQLLQRQASSAAFSTIVLSQVGVLLSCRSSWRNANPLLWFGIASELLLLLALLQMPALNALFSLTPLPPGLLGWLLMAPLLILAADGWLQRRRPHHDRGNATPAEAQEHG
jgi:Ca2+-transporting ATPase